MMILFSESLKHSCKQNIYLFLNPHFSLRLVGSVYWQIVLYWIIDLINYIKRSDYSHAALFKMYQAGFRAFKSPLI